MTQQRLGTLPWAGDQGVPPEVVRLRKQQVKNLFCLLLLSNGMPMFRMGDEFLQTQHGNNNAYNQVNETSWLDWRRRDTDALLVPAHSVAVLVRPR